MTDFTAYQRRAAETAIYDPALELHYLIPAVVDEVFELLDSRPNSDDELNEAGDVLWSAIMLRAALGLPLDIAPFDRGCHLRDFMEEPAQRLLHRWTKVVRDRQARPDVSDLALMDAATGRIVRLVMSLAERRGIGIEALAERNLDRLADRKKRHVLSGEGGNR